MPEENCMQKRVMSIAVHVMVVLFWLAGHNAAVAQDAYPSRPVRFIVPFVEGDAPGLVSPGPLAGRARVPGFIQWHLRLPIPILRGRYVSSCRLHPAAPTTSSPAWSAPS